MRKCKYYVGCYGFERTLSGFKTMRTVTSINQDGWPLFEMNVDPLEFTSEEADNYMRTLINAGYVAVVMRAPFNMQFICRN